VFCVLKYTAKLLLRSNNNLEDYEDEEVEEIEEEYGNDAGWEYDDWTYGDYSSYTYQDDVYEEEYWDYDWDSAWGDYA
jgi:hypothetical protein